MPLANYEQLLESLPNWLHREGDTQVMSVVPDMVTLAESEIYVKLRTRYQETTIAAQISGGTVTVPEDYVKLKYVYFDTNPVRNLTRKSADWILSQYPHRNPQSLPAFIARDAGVFIFGPYPDSDYILKGVYYRTTEPLSVTQTSPLLSRYPKAFLFGALSHAEKFIRNDPNIDAMMPVWKGEFAQAIQEAQDEADEEPMSGGRATMAVVGSMP